MNTKIPPVVAFDPSENFRATQNSISNSVTKDFLVKKSARSKHQILLKTKEDYATSKNSFMKNQALFFIYTLPLEKVTHHSWPHLRRTKDCWGPEGRMLSVNSCDTSKDKEENCKISIWLFTFGAFSEIVDHTPIQAIKHSLSKSWINNGKAEKLSAGWSYGTELHQMWRSTWAR